MVPADLFEMIQTFTRRRKVPMAFSGFYSSLDTEGKHGIESYTSAHSNAATVALLHLAIHPMPLESMAFFNAGKEEGTRPTLGR